MKPVKIFLFFISILFIIAGISWFTPSTNFDFLGWEIHLFSFSQAKPQINEDQVFTHKLDTIVQRISTTKDTLILGDTNIKWKYPVSDAQILSKYIQFPSDSIDYWGYFVDNLNNHDSIDRPIRIIYYGDSQIENDRITSSFREKVQERYGGSGRGLVPVADNYNSANNFIMTVSDNWNRTSVVGTKKTNLDVGVLGESFKIFSQHENNSATAWIKIKSIDPDRKNGFSVISLFYRANPESSIHLTINDTKEYNHKLTVSDKIKELRLKLGETPENFEMKFQTKSEITVYGISMESPTGIMVDNIALRGRASPGFMMIDSVRFQEMADLIKPTMLILHYGVNVVPNIRSEYSFYKEQLKQEINCINKYLPDVPVFLISTNDMAHKVNGVMQTYKNIGAVIQAQKEAALESGCAFWNLFDSMGGSGTIIKWVKQKPPLGNKDYVHFTMLGAKKIGYLLNDEFQKIVEIRNDNSTLANE